MTERQSCSHPTSNGEGLVCLSALVLRPDDVARLAGLVEQLMEFHNAIIYLQSDDIDFVTVRAIFDGLLGHFAHSDAIKPYLSATGCKLQDAAFSTGVTKLQSEPRGNLTVSEHNATKILAQLAPPNAAPANARARAPVDEATLTVVEKAVREVKRARLAQETTVITHNMALCVQPTTCTMERVFSRTKLILRNHRKRISMDTLEMLTMLRYNRHLWDATWLNGLDDETVAMPHDGEQEDQFLDFIDEHDTDSDEGLYDNDADTGLDSDADDDEMNLDSPEESDDEEVDI